MFDQRQIRLIPGVIINEGSHTHILSQYKRLNFANMSQPFSCKSCLNTHQDATGLATSRSFCGHLCGQPTHGR